MDVLRLSAFSQDGKGGNPAGVAFCDAMPGDEEMLRIAREVGYSETAFLVKQGMAGGCVILLPPWKSRSAFPVRFASAGAKHLIFVLRDRERLAGMRYDFDRVRDLMLAQGLITVSLLWYELDEIFHARNAFASGGVYEDPATGAAAAALAGYLRDIGWQGKSEFTILQGEDMGKPSRLRVKYGPEPGSSVSVSGETRHISQW